MANRGQQPDTLYTFLFSGLSLGPTQVLSEKFIEWCGIWKCNDAQARDRACRVIRKAMSDALHAGDYDGGSGDIFLGSDGARAAGSFRANTYIGGDCWPLREGAMVDKEDLDRFSSHAAQCNSQCITPM